MMKRINLFLVFLAALILGMGCSQSTTEPPTPQNLYDLDEMPGTLTAKVEEGGPNPAPIDLLMTNTGMCDLDFNISSATVDGAAWLDVTPKTGVLPLGVSSVSKALTITVNFDVIETPLTPGTYTGSIIISGTCLSSGTPAIGSPARISVNLTVTSSVGAFVIDDTDIDVDTTFLSNVWTPTASGPDPRVGHSAVWTGRQMIVWGGSASPDPSGAFSSGGLYSDLIDSWDNLVMNGPTARLDHSAVWTGTEMIVFGGTGTDGLPVKTGSAYDPAVGTWGTISEPVFMAPITRQAAIWTGTEMIVWGGMPVNSGGRYDPVGDTWSSLSATGMPQCEAATAVWTGFEMIVWGDAEIGGIYDPAGDSWVPVDGQGVIEPRLGHSAVWTGREMIIWGGLVGGVSVDTGARYDLDTNTWSPIADTGAPAARNGHQAVWTGNRMIIWGGLDDGFSNPGEGGIYDPATESWVLMGSIDEPLARRGHSAVWTGEKMIIWGGMDEVGSTVTAGGIYE